MNKRLLTSLAFTACFYASLMAANPHGDLRIEMFPYYNLVVDHNIQTPNGASPESVYLGVKICNDGSNDMSDVSAFIGNYGASTPGIYPTTTPSGMPYSGTFSFTHEGGQADASRYIGDLAAGQCVTQYWLTSYPLMDAAGNKVCGAVSNENDDLHLTYDVWATAKDGAFDLQANASNTVQLRAMISAMANKIWPQTTSKVPNEFLAAFPDKQLGWRQTTPVESSYPGATVILEGIWFDLGNIRKGFDNDGDFVPDYNFLLQPVGNPSLYDANCFRLVKVSGLIVIKLQGNATQTIEFTDQMHFRDIPSNNTGGVGMVFYEFAVLNAPCAAQLTPYEEVASGSNNEKHNGDYGASGGALSSVRPNAAFVKDGPASAGKGDQIEYSLTLTNNSSNPIGVPQFGAPLVIQDAIPANTVYVAGSATASNTLPAGNSVKVLYSTDHGLNWEKQEPTPASLVTNIQWWVKKSLAAAASVSVTFDLQISGTYPGALLTNTGGVSSGNSEPFLTDDANTAISGPLTITDKVFLDDGTGTGGVKGDGIQNGTEAGIPNVAIKLYLDENESGIIEENEQLIQSVNTNASGQYTFNNLSETDYVVVVQYNDVDIPGGWTNTTDLEYALDSIATDPIDANFGFATLLQVTNTLATPPPVYEGQNVTFNVSVQNTSFAADNSLTQIAWAGSSDAATTLTNPANLVGAPNGTLANGSNWTKKAVVKGFTFPTQTGTIEKVELLYQFCTDVPVNNDYLQASFVKTNGQTQIAPNPVWSKTSSPSLNDYVGAPNLGFVTIDITGYQNWTWSTINAAWSTTLEGLKIANDDGAHLYVDAIGVRITSSCCAAPGVGVAGNPHTVVTDLPLDYEFDNAKLQYVSSTLPPDEVSNGVLIFNELGPLYPGQASDFTVNFKAINTTEVNPVCTVVPAPWSQCIAPTSGYDQTKVVTGTVNWATLISGIPATNVTGELKFTGTGTIVIPSGDFILNSCLVVIDGPKLVVKSGKIVLNQWACFLVFNSTIQTSGDIQQNAESFFCINDCTLEVGDEAANGFFNTANAASVGNWKTNGGNLYMKNVCFNTTRDFTMTGTSWAEAFILNTCGEVGDQGANHFSSGLTDASDLGIFNISKTAQIFNSEFNVQGNITIASGGVLTNCNVDYRSFTGNFTNSGTHDGGNVAIWVPDNKQIQQSAGSWTAVLEARRGTTSGTINLLPTNATESLIAENFINCSCNPGTPVYTSQVFTDPVVSEGRNGDNLVINLATDPEPVQILNAGSVSGYVFSDKDSDGWIGAVGYEATDYFMPGVIVSVFGCKKNGNMLYPALNASRSCTHSNNGGTWTLMGKDTTDTGGFWDLKGLLNGYYYASVDLASIPGTEVQKCDPDKTSGLCTTCDNAWKLSSGNLSTVGIIGSANDFTNINFGYAVNPLIAGYVWEDQDGDGIKEAGENYLGSVTVERVATGCTAGSTCPTVTTNSSGYYVFPTLTANTTYSIRVRTNTLPAGSTWTQTYESDGTINNDISKTPLTGQFLLNNDYAFRRSGGSDISGSVYYDWHGNGFPNSGDEGIAGVQLEIYRDANNNNTLDATDPLVATTATNGSGNYIFTGLAAGSYIVEVQEGTLGIFPEQTEDPGEPGLCSTCDGRSVHAGLNGTSDLTGVDFGYHISGDNEITGRITFDNDGNGFENGSDYGLSNVEASLEADLNGDGTFVLISTIVSDADGDFTFTDLPDGFYRVVVNPLDSDIPLDHTGAVSLLTTNPYFTAIVEGETMTHVNGEACTGDCDPAELAFGFSYPGAVISNVFYDANGNGTQDWNETGIPGVTLYICDALALTCNATNALDTAITANGSGLLPEGAYLFDGVPQGNYTVAVDPATLPVNMVLTADPSTDGIPCYSPLNPGDPYFSFLSAECDGSLESFEVHLGNVVTAPNFGYKPCSAVGDLVWWDANGDGTVSAEESGMPGLTVTITNTVQVTHESIVYPVGTFVETTETDFDGMYAFDVLPDGVYSVVVTPPASFAGTYDSNGGGDNATAVIVSGCTITNLGITFGMRPSYPNSISGTVCLDSDQDGMCNTGGETFPAGTDVYLYTNSGLLYGQTETDAAGTFFFDNLGNDTFIVSVSKVEPPLQLAALTTSFGDTPGFDLTDSDNNVRQTVAVNADITGVMFATAFADTFDLGDLPLPYLTRIEGLGSGPAHILPAVPTLYLGASVDFEFTPTLNAPATGDDLDGTDDEDGVTFNNANNWVEGSNGGSLTVAVTGSGWLTGWADFNGDGDFTDAGEAFVSVAVATGSYNVSFSIPAGTDLSGGRDIFFRFRLFAAQPAAPATAFGGIYTGGEVEDYMVSICKDLTNPGTIAGDESGCDGYDAGLIAESHAPEGGSGSLEYKWQQSTDGLTWADIAGATTTSFDPGVLAQSTRFRRAARRDNCLTFSYSNVVTKTIVTNFNDPGIVAGDEEACGVFDPGMITSVVSPSGGTGSGTPAYVWQESTDGGATWADMLNSNSPSYNPGIISQTTIYRRGTYKSPCAALLYSNEITKMVTVNYTDAGSVTGDEIFCGGYDPGVISGVTLPSGGANGFEMFQWERSTNGGASWGDISGATLENYNPGTITQTTLYRRKARRVPCAVWVNSNVVTKSVKPYPTASITTFPTSVSGNLCELADYEFAAADAGANVNYTWNFGTYALPSTSAAGLGPHFRNFNVPNNVLLTNTTVTLTTEKDGCVSNDSKNLTFRPEITSLLIDRLDPSNCGDTDGEIEIFAAYPAGAVLQYSKNAGLSWQSGNKFQNLTAGVYDIRVRYVGGDCAENFGLVAISDPPPQADILISASQTCTGEMVTIEAIPIASNPTFAWAFGSSAVPNTISGPGPHTIYFTSGGAKTLAVSMTENGCVGVRDTTISIVQNYSSAGNILGGETLCSTFDPTPISAGANPSGGIGGTQELQWEQRESDGLGGWTAWADIAGATTSAYDPGVIAATSEFRRKARRGPCADWLVTNTVTARLVQKPNLTDDSYFTVCPGFAYADNVSENDLALVSPTYQLLVFPTNGTLDFEANGEFIYDPNSTFCGTDEYTYKVCNEATGCCDTAHVIIDLTDVNPPTIANVPANILISCDDQIPVADAVDVVENCQNVSIGFDEISTKGTEGCALYNYQQIRRWNGTDYCTNSATAQQVLTIADQTAPDIFRIYTLPNGKRMIAGVMENVSGHWKTVKLPVQFATQPVIFAQVTSRNDLAPVNARLRNVSTTQFQVRLQEEEAGDDVHAQENVSWVAFEKGAFNGSMLFEVNTWLLSSASTHRNFSQTYSLAPDVLASIQTTNDLDPATVRFSNHTATGLDLSLQEETSASLNVAHNLETVGYLAIQCAGNIVNNTGEVIGEISRIAPTNASMTVNLLHKYHNPVVIFGGASSNDGEPISLRVMNVTPTSFSVNIDEWSYQNGIHSAETLSFIVVEGSLPLDRHVPCDAVPQALTIGSQIIAIDNCDAAIQLTMTEDPDGFNCQTDSIYSRIWTTTDDCGNAVTLTQQFILLDTVAPQFTVPPTVIISCTVNKDNLTLTGDVTDETDNCADSLQAVYTDNVTNLLVCSGHILRTWTLSDACGNSRVKTQVIRVAAPDDTDGDGVIDFFDFDDDNDGIPDMAEGGADLDQDGIPNWFDRDSDNDGISDLVEIGGRDTNGDGVVDNHLDLNWDHDGDGFAYGYDGNDIDSSLTTSVNPFDPASPANDPDEDGSPNFLDRDSDNDGIGDLAEAGGTDTDGNGVADYPTLLNPATMIDNDQDGYSDVYDSDDDGTAGAEDANQPLIISTETGLAGGLPSDRPDFDGDGLPDFLDLDSDNDGISDLVELGGVDTNGDGRIDTDANSTDINGDGMDDRFAGYPVLSTDEDGVPLNGRPEDHDADGSPYNIGDADFDGSPNHRDYDSDGDHITDILEVGFANRDANSDGILDNFTDGNHNGFDDVAEASSNILTEADGALADGRPQDGGDTDLTAYRGSKPDGAFGIGNGNPDVDDDGDNLLNFLDTDSDDDLLPDQIEDRNFNAAPDAGETGIFNPDSDGDGIPDGTEDANRNGAFSPDETDPLNPNTDGDPLPDGVEDDNKNGVADPSESDPRNPCDPLLSAECRGLTLDIKVNLLGALVNGDSTNYMRDDLRKKGVIPAEEPYSSLGHLDHIGEDPLLSDSDPNAGGVGIPIAIGSNSGTLNYVGGVAYKEKCENNLFWVTGGDAPVDWVMVELRPEDNPDSVLATRAAILQRDGDVKEVDGISLLAFQGYPAGNYFVSVRHRNHLGVMTHLPLLLSPTPTLIDFTDPATETSGNHARANYDGQMALWPGDLNGDARIIYQGPSNDVVPLFQKVMLTEDNVNELANFIITGYSHKDVNMDGNTIYQGPNNDRVKILIHSTLAVPSNTLQLANFVLFENLP